MTRSEIKVYSGIVVAIIAFLYFSSPDSVVVTEKGEVRGLLNKGRHAIQGDRFWRKQLKAAKKELHWNKVVKPERDREIMRQMAIADAEMKKADNELYKKIPSLKPTKAELKAERLREMAYEIEEKELFRISDQVRLRDITRLEKIIPVIKLKLAK